MCDVLLAFLRGYVITSLIHGDPGPALLPGPRCSEDSNR